MLYFLTWYFILWLFALAALPLGWTWFRYLPDRGWGLLRPLGLLLVGFTVWFLGSFGLLRLSAGSGIAGLLALFVLGLLTLYRWEDGWSALAGWWYQQRRIILAQEVVFLASFAFWTWYRIHDGFGIGHTEQPMDFALMNAIARGGEIPPNDPWLSGFAISYYYLGYLIMAQVTALTGVSTGVAYNLALTSLAGLASVGIFSLSYNLLAGAEQSVDNEYENEDHEDQTDARHLTDSAELKHLSLAFLAVILLLGVSNLTGLLTMIYHRGIGPDSLYIWFGVNNLIPDAATGTRLPQEGWWWWSASRTLYDTAADGTYIEVIDEFPFFSFLLGDMHPHVLVLPFTLLALTIAFNALRGALSYPNLYRWRIMMQPPEAWQVRDRFGQLTLLLTVIVIGAMGMLNTWYYPTQLAILAIVWLIAALLGTHHQEWQTSLTSWVSGGAFLICCSILLYLPFYVSFSSQANGIRLSQWSTPPQQYLLMFGLFWVVLVPLVLSQKAAILAATSTMTQRAWFISAMMLLIDALILFLLLHANLDDGQLAILMAGLWLLVPLALSFFIGPQDPSPLAIIQVAGFPFLAGLLLQRFTIALVAFFLLLSLSALWANVRVLFLSSVDSDSFSDHQEILIEEDQSLGRVRQAQASLIFVLLLSAMSFLLTMGSDIFYIEDYFPGRMNTIFKLYYQAWLLMAIASTFGLHYLLKRLPLTLRIPWLVLFALGMLGSMWYPFEALPTKADFDGAANWDGRFWMQKHDPDRFAAIEWLDALPSQVVILEKKGNSYWASESALAGWTGHSTLIGWAGHEEQWRGSSEQIDRREPVIEQIYQHTDPQAARILVREWGIEYVVVTPAERSTYNLTERQVDKFRQFMTPVFEQGNVIIFGR